MIIDRVFHNIKCDSCGALIDEETWWDDKDALLTDILRDCNWIECEGGRHYCDECYSHDDDDNIVTKDGRKWTDYDHKEIRKHHMNYLDLSEDMTLTQFRMELEKERLSTMRWLVGFTKVCWATIWVMAGNGYRNCLNAARERKRQIVTMCLCRTASFA